MSQQHQADLEDRPAPPTRSRSNTSGSQRDKSRPKSRTSTASLQSVDVGHSFQAQPVRFEQHQQPHFIPMPPHHPGASQQVPIQPQPQPHHPAMMHPYAPQMQQVPYSQGPHYEQHPPPAHDMRPVSQQGFHHEQQYVPYPPQMQQYQPHMQHIRRDSGAYEGSPAPEDSNAENKRKKGTASTMANDQELRRLLQQHQGKTLKEVAHEVQKTEGHNGGKAEKAKQVFAMLWLQENCVRSSSSVRRDRVFSRYTERCGSERVPTLNPASFGKLVRIIFPNVQTRRLGVRGESKYHYVDLSLTNNDDEDRLFASTQSLTHPSTSAGIKEDPSQDEDSVKPFQQQTHVEVEGRPPSRHSMETADFPAPSTSFEPQTVEEPKLAVPEPPTNKSFHRDCQEANTSTIRIPIRGQTASLVTALPAVRANMPGSVATYLAMPRPNLINHADTLPQGELVELPDIAPYLAGVDHDPSIARSLYNLYRSYCTDVIESFRKVREKHFWQNHTAFNGKMTVPVAKLFNLECLAPWIQECDMRMYKGMARFIAPLALQNVPDMVWGNFDRVANKLVSHIIAAFEEKCPVHVVVAKAVPAARFANLLKKLKNVNTATLQMARLLDDVNYRTQMWLDLLSVVDPERVLDESSPPPELFPNIEGVLKHDLRTLLDPAPGDLVTAAEDDPTSPYPNFLNEPSGELPSVLSLDVLDQPIPLLDKWISWLQCLPETFEGHHPNCMLNWHLQFWYSMIQQLGNNGALSFQHWWFTQHFATSLLSWMAEMQGLLMSEADQKRFDTREVEKSAALLASSSSLLGKRKRLSDDHTSRPAKRVTSEPVSRKSLGHVRHTTTPNSPTNAAAVDDTEPTLPSMPQHPSVAVDPDTDAEMEEISRAGPLNLPSFPNYNLSSPLKMSKTPMRRPMLGKGDTGGGAAGMNDDSGIDLGLDIDAEAVGEAKKFDRRDWFLSSDPVVDVGGQGVVV